MRHTTTSTRWLPGLLVAGALLLGWTAWTTAGEPDHELKGWKKGRGWGWVWGKDDEVGSLNAMTPQAVLEAIGLVKQGKVYDLGIDYDRTSYKWPGHSPGEIISFRTPEGVKRQQDLDFTAPSVNPALLAWHSCALFINDNVATQIDSLGHVTTGEDNHWYNGFHRGRVGRQLRHPQGRRLHHPAHRGPGDIDRRGRKPGSGGPQGGDRHRPQRPRGRPGEAGNPDPARRRRLRAHRDPALLGESRRGP